MRTASKTRWAVASCLLVMSCLAASAHPHVWVAVKSEVLFGADGKITGIRHAWTFDEMYSAFATQGFGTDGKPCLHRDGYAVWRVRYDEHGNPVGGAA